MNNATAPKVLVNKVAIATFLRDRGIPAREAIFAAVILGDKGIDRNMVADAFADVKAVAFAEVLEGLDEAQVRAAE